MKLGLRNYLRRHGWLRVEDFSRLTVEMALLKYRLIKAKQALKRISLAGEEISAEIADEALKTL